MQSQKIQIFNLCSPQGTNTYLVGQTNPYILVDTAEGRDEYIPMLEQALRGADMNIRPEQPDVSDIILTHKHHDHTGGLPSVLALLRRRWDERNPGAAYVGPRIHKLPLKAPHPHLEGILKTLPSNSFTSASSDFIIHDLKEGQVFQATPLSPSESPLSLEVIHTPGHTEDSLCLYLAADRALFTADTVLGYGSSVFEDLWSYMTSLRKMIDFNGKEGSGEPKYTTVYPGHGPTAAHTQVDMYLRHRVDRENQVLGAINSAPPGGSDAWTTWEIMKSIYARYPQELWEPAAQSVDLHLRKLVVDGKVRKLDGEGNGTRWKLIQ